MEHLDKTMTEYVLEQAKRTTLPFVTRFTNCEKVAEFYSETLNPSMFVPAVFEDGKWVILEEPKNYKQWTKKALNTPYDIDLSKYEQYQSALKNVYFDEFFIHEGNDTKPSEVKSITEGNFHVFWFNNIEGWYLSRGIETIEDLIPYKLKLTPTIQNRLKRNN